MWLWFRLKYGFANIGLELKIRYQPVKRSYLADMMQDLCRLQPVNSVLLFHATRLSREITPPCCAGIFAPVYLAHRAAAHQLEVTINKLLACPVIYLFIFVNVVMKTYFWWNWSMKVVNLEVKPSNQWEKPEVHDIFSSQMTQ